MQFEQQLNVALCYDPKYKINTHESIQTQMSEERDGDKTSLPAESSRPFANVLHAQEWNKVLPKDSPEGLASQLGHLTPLSPADQGQH